MWAFVVAALSALAYANSLTAPFLFDDAGAVLNNPSIRKLGSWAVLQPPTDGSTTTGRPLLNASYAVNYAISGTNPWSYHAVNVAIHVLAALVLMSLVRRAANRLSAAGHKTLGPSWLAPAITVLWALHPLATETVVCVAQRSESLASLCYLLTLYGFARAVDPVPDSKGWLAFSVAACALGLASKEIVATAPLLVLLYDRTFVSGSFRDAWRLRRRYYLALAATWLVLVFLLAGLGGSRGVSAGFGAGVSAWSYLLKQCEALVLYLKLSIWPHPLVLDYGTGVPASLSEVIWQAIAVVALLAVTVWALMKRPVIGFLGAWFFLVLSPSSSVVPLVAQTMAEHRMYLPLAAIVALFVGTVRRFAGPAALPVLLLVAGAFAWLTVSRNAVYRDELSLWQANVADYPGSARAHNNLARLLQIRGHLDAAELEYARAVELDPEYVLAHYNWGVALLQRGRLAEAIQQLTDAVSRAPRFADARLNLGVALLRAGRTQEAASELQTAIELQPEAVDARFNLGVALQELGRDADAVRQFNEVVNVRPDLVEAQVRLGQLEAKLGNHAEAKSRLETALRFDPHRGDALSTLGLVLAQMGRYGEAARRLEAAVEIAPNDPDIRANLGNVYLLQGEADRAVKQYEESLKLRPDDARVRANLSLAHEALRSSAR